MCYPRHWKLLWFAGSWYATFPFEFVCASFDIPLTQTYNFGYNFALITLITMAAYTWFTVRTTAWR